LDGDFQTVAISHTYLNPPIRRSQLPIDENVICQPKKSRIWSMARAVPGDGSKYLKPRPCAREPLSIVSPGICLRVCLILYYGRLSPGKAVRSNYESYVTVVSRQG